MERLGNIIARACAQIHPGGPQPLRLILRGTIRPFPVDNFDAAAPTTIYQHRKGTPRNIEPEQHPHTTSTKVDNGPDRPVIQTTTLGKLETFTSNPLSAVTNSCSSTLEVHRNEWTRIETRPRLQGSGSIRLTVVVGERKEKLFKNVPTAEVPLLPARKISKGGGRTIGGGTSDEALSRARKNQRRRA